MFCVQAFGVVNCKDVKLSGLSFKNGPMFQIVMYGTVGATITNVHISAPADSPNTDGVHIEQSQQVEISRSAIGTG